MLDWQWTAINQFLLDKFLDIADDKYVFNTSKIKFHVVGLTPIK